MPTLSEITELYQQVVDAQPDVIADAAARWRRAGARAADTADVAQRADTITAESFRNGTGVYDAPTATRATRAALGDGGEHLDQVGRALQVVADELRTTQTDVGKEWFALQFALAAVDANRRNLTLQAYLHPQAEVDRAAAALDAQECDALDTHGRAIAELVDRYDRIVANRGRTFSDIGATGKEPTR